MARVFINRSGLSGSVALPEGVLSPAYLRNVADFLVRARAHHVGVILCAESFPRVAPYTEGLRLPPNVGPAMAEHLEPAHIRAKGRFFADLITALQAVQPRRSFVSRFWSLRVIQGRPWVGKRERPPALLCRLPSRARESPGAAGTESGKGSTSYSFFKRG